MKAKTFDEHIATAVSGHLELHQAARQLSQEWSQLTPEMMDQRCAELNQLQETISKTDSDLIDVLQLAGPESTTHPRLKEYRSLLEGTKKIFDQISAKAYSQKKILQSELIKLKKSRAGIAGYGSQISKSGNIVKEKS